MCRGKAFTYYAGLMLLLILQLQQICASTNNYNRRCAPSSCGEVTNISYPFRLKDHDPENCGNPQYELACENNRTVLTLFSVKYFVKSIDYRNFTIRLVDSGIQDGDCSSIPLHSLSVSNFSSYNNEYVWEPYEIHRQEYIEYWREPWREPGHVTYLNCRNPVRDDPLYVDTSLCINQNFTGGHLYAIAGKLSAGRLKLDCHVKLITMTSSPAALDGTDHDQQPKQNLSYAQIHKMLIYGFNLSWVSGPCQDLNCRPNKYDQYCAFNKVTGDLQCVVDDYCTTPLVFDVRCGENNLNFPSRRLLIIDSIKARLNSWRSKQLSIGGRVTLINSVIASLPLYLFSFYKAPKKVIEAIIKLQRRFLWGGDDEHRKLSWVSWGNICKPKAKGGLGVKNLEVFNIALLTKWRWRILTEQGNPLWKEVLVSRYGLKGTWPNELEYRRGWGKTSLWWRDLCQLGVGSKLREEWFDDIVKLKLGRGDLLKFWKDRWVGRDSFAELFPTIYNSYNNKDVVIEEMGGWIDGVWRWNVHWLEDLPREEENNVEFLIQLLQTVSLQDLTPDRWICLLDTINGFTVKSCYAKLCDMIDEQANSAAANSRLPAAVASASSGSVNSVAAVSARSDSVAAVTVSDGREWKQLWKNDVPSKVLIFGWRVLLNRIATRDALYRIGILQSHLDKCCVFCFEEDETTLHLFLSCRVIKVVWQKIFAWMGVPSIVSDDVVSHFLEFGTITGGKKLKGIKHLIWLAVIWNIWLMRNKIVFKGEVASISTLVSGIMDSAWSWFKARKGKSCGLGWSDWYQCPMGCFDSLKSSHCHVI